MFAMMCMPCATGLSLEDNGNYTCEISGPHNALLGFVTHRIFVRGMYAHVSALRVCVGPNISMITFTLLLWQF